MAENRKTGLETLHKDSPPIFSRCILIRVNVGIGTFDSPTINKCVYIRSDQKVSGILLG